MKDETSLDLLNLFKSESPFINTLSTSIVEFKIINHECLCKLYKNEDLRKSFIKALEYNKNKKWAKDTINKLLSTKNADGTFYELLAYAWLTHNGSLYKQEVITKKGQTLSKNAPILDGKFLLGSKKTYFDIKTFNIPNNILDELIYKLNDENDLSQYIFMIEGKTDCSYKVLQNEIFYKYKEIKQDIINRTLKEPEDFFYHIKNTPISIKVIKDRSGVHMSTHTFNPYKWAQDNELFFIKNASQFTNNNPFLLICVCPPNFTSLSPEIQLRSIARRAFIHLPKIKADSVNMYLDKNINTKYTKSSLKIIMRRLSGILFIDYKGTDVKKMKGYLYINPNSKNPLKNYKTLTDFSNNIQVDNFVNDNY